MKAALITFHESANIGALLQAYALQETLTSLAGEQAEVIDYHSLFRSRRYGPSLSKGLRVNLNLILSAPIRRRIGRNARSFVQRYLRITPESYRSSLDMMPLNGKYDVFICGSDQIWNALNTGRDEAYFLDFVTDARRRIPYAPSLGLSEIPTDLNDFYVRNLGRFSELSVREESGRQAIARLTGKNAEVVLDPTLLLRPADWASVARPVRVGGPYVFVYYIGYSPRLMSYARALSAREGLRMVAAAHTVRDFLCGSAAVVSPEEFISYIANARYVVTNSFHGTAFSVNFEKQFAAFGNKGAMSRTNSRITDFLQTVGLSDRYGAAEESAEVESPALDPIDYSSIACRLAAERKRSLEFLRRALEGARTC